MSEALTCDQKVTEARGVLNSIAADSELAEAVRAAGELDDAPMTHADFEELADLEADIKGCWWKMGRSFAEIKAKKLYRQTTDGSRRTWNEYCRTVHDLTKQRVDTIIRAAEVRAILETETKVSVLPATASQAVELNGLEPVEMATAAADAVNMAVADNRSPTANDYRLAASKVKPKNKSRRVNGTTSVNGRKSGRTSQYSPSLPSDTILNRFEVEVRIGFKLSVPEHVTAEAVAEAIRHAERWNVDLALPFGYELSEKGIVVGHVRPWNDNPER